MTSIRQLTLKEQLANVDEILADIKEEVARYEAERTKIETALKALGESPKASKKKQGSKKPAPTKADVQAALKAVHATGVSGADEIKAAVEREITNAGFSKAGLSLPAERSPERTGPALSIVFVGVALRLSKLI